MLRAEPRAARRALLLVGAVIFFSSGRWVEAADRFVSTSGNDTASDCLASSAPCATIAYAVTQATSGDVIKVTRGQYLEALFVDYTSTLTLSGGWSSDFTSQDTAGHPSILAGGGVYGVDLLKAVAGAGEVLDLTVDGFVLTGGYSAVQAYSMDDGALTLSLQNCSLKANRTWPMRVVSSGTSTLSISMSGCTLLRNRSRGEYETILLSALDTSSLNATLDDVLIQGSYASDLGTGHGISMTALSIGAASGASISVVGTDVDILQNRAGGIVVAGNGSCTVALTNSRVAKNTRGGVQVAGAATSLSLTNTVIAGNRSFGTSGLGFSGGTLDVVNSTIRGNRTRSAVSLFPTGAMYLGAGTVTLRNTIVWGNRSVTEEAADMAINGATVDVDHSDLGPGVSGTFNDLGGNISADPLFVSRRDEHLTAGSPAVDAGTCTGAPATDFEGDPRPSGGACDIGADELAP